MNVKPYGKNGLRCMLCDKKFSTENLMAVHFSRRHREEAMGESRAVPMTFPCASPPPLVSFGSYRAQSGLRVWTESCRRPWTKR